MLGRAVLYKSGNVDLFFVQDKEHSTVQANLDNYINIFDVSGLESLLYKLNSIMIDPSTTPMSIITVIQNKQVVKRGDPCLIHKTVKNQIEITGAINAHIRDGVAVTNFLCWFKNNNGTKLEAEEKILEYRKEQDLFKQPSFPNNFYI
ncbi:aminopeptidase P family N-terminal domain-containing protein [Wolbachia endosymbiont of Mansonella ozzardi]|uniref:aminopeptidase P family N-terminal domain-containing protein n=1 Tax=Wolbachia endosymbiont of Mansonella ozzardi TaxID=137464 RepID=UPI0034CD2DAB